MLPVDFRLPNLFIFRNVDRLGPAPSNNILPRIAGRHMVYLFDSPALFFRFQLFFIRLQRIILASIFMLPVVVNIDRLNAGDRKAFDGVCRYYSRRLQHFAFSHVEDHNTADYATMGGLSQQVNVGNYVFNQYETPYCFCPCFTTDWRRMRK